MKRKFFASFLSLCMVLSLVPMTALAAPEDDGVRTPSTQAVTELPAAVGGVITLTEDVELSRTYTVAETENIRLDLNGHTISPATGFTGGHLITVSEGGSLTLTDSVGNGKIESKESSVRGILNHGTFNMDSGAINVYNYAVTNEVTQTSYDNDQPIICNITGGELSASYAWTIFLKGAGIAGQASGNNQGINYSGSQSIKNDLIQTSIAGNAEVTGIQAITTNASNGIYAGFTLNISGNARIVDESASDSAIYLPAVGVTTISENAYISGAQGIRFCAGELTITGGTIVGTDVSDEEDLIAGGSGGTKGAIVIGKAGGGYVGDVKVNISGTAKVVNTAEGTDGATRPAIVVSDKNMGDESKGYDDLSISVNVNGATITGDVVKVSNLSDTSTQDGGNTSLVIEKATVTGNVSNQSKTGLTVKDSTITGNVTNTSTGNTALLGTTVNGTVTDNSDEGNTGTIYNDKDIETAGNSVAVNEITGTAYADLATALSNAKDGDTIRLVADITNVTLTGSGAGQYTQAFNINKSITLDGQNHKITVKEKTGEGHVHVLGINADNVTVKNLTIDGGDKSRSGISVYHSKVIKLENVTSQNNTASGVVVNNSAVTADGLKTAGNGWHGVNVDPKDGESASIVLTNADLRDTNGIQVDNGTSGHTATVTIESGYISKVTDTTGSGTTAITVNDGSFGESVAEYVKDGLKYEANANGIYTYYETLDEALAVSDTVSSVEAAKDGANAVTVTVKNGNDETKITLKKNDTYKLPTLPNQGYNRFQGWRSSVNGEVYPGGQEVTITADTTFTAVWSYTPPANPNYKITIGAMENGTVTANPTAAKAGATVTLTPVPDEGYALSTLTVTDRVGDAVRVTEQADGTYTFTMPNGQVTVNATFVETEEPVAEPFVDVAEGDWFYDAVVDAYQNELMDGVGGNRFAPNSETTRAQLVTILYRLEGQPAVSGDLPFTDVEAGIWYTDAILWAAQNNIVNGVSDTEFAPGDDLTRQQLVTILYRYAEAKGYDVSASADLSGYPDADQVQDYAQPAMAWAVAENIIQGMEDGTLKPAGNASRAQIATSLMRFCEDVAQ